MTRRSTIPATIASGRGITAGLPWEGGGKPSAWSPLALGSLTLWLDERQLVIATGYSSWTSNAASVVFSQGTAANQPGTSATINGYAAPDFDGTNDNMLSDVNASSIATTTAWEFAAVYQPDVLGADAGDGVPYTRTCLFSSVTGATIGCSITTSGVKTFIYDGAYKNSPYAAISTGAASLITGRLESSTIYARVGAASEVSAAAGTITSLASQLRIGANYNATAFVDGKLASLVFTNAVLSAAERASLRSYLGAKYGVAS